MSYPTEVMPQKRRLLLTIGVIAAVSEWAAAIGAWSSSGAARSLLGGTALFFGLSLFVLSCFRPGGRGRGAFAANFKACTAIYGAMFLGFFLFSFGPVEGAVLGLFVAPIVGLAMAVRQTWPLGPGGAMPSKPAPPVVLDR